MVKDYTNIIVSSAIYHKVTQKATLMIKYLVINVCKFNSQICH